MPEPVNFFSRLDQRLLRAVQRPEFNIQEMRRADLAKYVPELSASALSRKLLWLRQHYLIKKVAHAYRFYITRIGRAATAAACSLTEFNIIPAMAHAR